MTDQANIIDGQAMAAKMRKEIAAEVAKMETPPGLAVILAGDDPASHVYVRNKIRACEKAGIKSFEARLPEKATQDEVAAEIAAFNKNPDVHGILLQLPLPAPLDARALIGAIDPEKDVDGLTHVNIGKLAAGDKSGLVPCTPQGALALIKSVRPEIEGEHAVIIGRSLLFGKPMAQLLLAENATVTQTHSKTPRSDLVKLCKVSDIIIAAVGQANMVKGDWIKPGAVVIDVGINRLPAAPGEEKGKLCGDVDFDEAVNVAGAITPVPGGVGPMTIACLLKNTVKAAQSA